MGGMGATQGGDKKCLQNIIRKNLKGRHHVGGGQAEGGKIILKWVLKKQDMRVWTGVIWLRIRPSDGFL
jgi:hypothetical protein